MTLKTHVRSLLPLVGLAVFLFALQSKALYAQTDQDDAAFLIDSTAADLASPDAATAANAEKQLIGLGEQAIPAIQKIMHENRSPQVQKLGQEVLYAMESKFKMEPTLVTLKLDEVSPHEVFNELSKIGGVRAEGQWDFWRQQQQGMPRTISVNFDKEPFAQAFYETCQKAHIYVQQGNSGPNYTLYPSYDNSRHTYPTFVSGPMFFYLESISRNSGIDLGSKEEDDELSIDMQILVDPKLPVTRMYNDVVLTEATGDSGESLIDPERNGPSDSASWSNIATFYGQQDINLKFKTGANKTIKSLKGAARFAIQSSPTKIEFTDFTPGKSVTTGNWTVKLDQFSPNDNGYTAHIIADNSALSDNIQQFPGVVIGQLYDAKSLPYYVEAGGGNFSPKHSEFDIYFRPGHHGGKPQAGPPAKLVITVSNTTRVIRVPFEFTDLPIPSPAY
jgi:hypothetical protein